MMNTILIVDDSMTDLHITQISLQQAGFLVVTARSEQEAKAQIANQKPDLIVLDVVLPDRSGFELCRALKGEEKTKKIPVVMCSSKSTKMDRYWGLQQGADAYIAKPIQTEELLKTVQKLL
ncbi:MULTISPECIES: response regulator [unclassified Leptolyngbya]|uniref:response regulator transcription factor n=2 Tax=Leptolyngbya TaxID=47251 RepID=UPI00321F6E36